jgi:hypothetical protein
MQMRIVVSPDGQTRVETLSTLEDLWHDFLFFKLRGEECDQAFSETDRLTAKRYRRAALLTIIFYFEGVLNRWLRLLLSPEDWQSEERKSLEKKVDLVHTRLPEGVQSKPDIREAKRLRNMLAHLKPGVDIELYESITGELLEETESAIVAWLGEVETSLKLERHPDTRIKSQEFTDKLGEPEPGSEGYSGDM